MIAATARADEPTLSQQAIDTLTSIESIPTQDDLTSEFGSGSGSAIDNAVATLSAIATDSTVDPGVQIHAIRGLGEYPSIPQAHDTLVLVMQLQPVTNRGTAVVILRAALEAIGNLATVGHETPGDVDLLVPFLAHPSQDIRVTAARSLADLCDTAAISPLRARLVQENVNQVQLAISEALRVLGSCAL